MHAGVSLILVIVNFVATGGVQESFQSLLSLAVVLQLIPFLYMFAALLKIAFAKDFVAGHYGKVTLVICRLQRLVTTILALRWLFSLHSRSSPLLRYEIWMFGGTVGFIGLAAFFFYVYGSRKAARKLALGSHVV